MAYVHYAPRKKAAPDVYVEVQPFDPEKDFYNLTSEQKWRYVEALRYTPKTEEEEMYTKHILQSPQLMIFHAPPYPMTPEEKARHPLYYGWTRNDIFDLEFNEYTKIPEFTFDLDSFPELTPPTKTNSKKKKFKKGPILLSNSLPAKV